MEGKGKALTFQPGATTPVTTEFSHWRECTLKFLQGAVGGYIELIPHFETHLINGKEIACLAYCNEDGKRLELPLNTFATELWNAAIERTGGHNDTGDYLVGTVVIVTGDAEFMRGHCDGEDEE
jgi:hypothetical protein